ncbi:MAG TPA: TetR/AcrR family transcriptional regulator [Xanthobacteraceae bacterium]|jgi:AcrR family transcriptional regulator|nr:TetR/AcrR family transcriptional regulator [Xanthobacteraceae bacterium]
MKRFAIPGRSRIETGEDYALSELMQHKASGLRERNKLDKFRRIKEAASELFIRKGYDDTTTREIAVRAGVGLGTIFVYAATKRDLLFLIVNDELQEVVEKAAAGVRPERPMLDNLLRIFQWHYRYFAQEPQLSRLALREMSFYDTGPEAQKFLKTRERLIALIVEIVRIAFDQKAISSTERPELIAWVIFSIYQIEVRHWLSSDELNLRRGLNALRRQLVLLMNGLSPRPVR